MKKRPININGWFVVAAFSLLFNVAFLLWIAEDAQAQTQAQPEYVTMSPNLSWARIQCYDDHPFQAEREMIWDDELGLIEINHAAGMQEPIALIISGYDVQVALVYENADGQYSIGLQCPEYHEREIHVHLREPVWGMLND